MSSLKNNRGAALLMALFALMVLITIAMDVGFETKVEYISSAQKINRLKAYYAARSGVEFSLLRVLLYKKARALYGKTLDENNMTHVLDPLWQMPWAWPPIVPEDIGSVSKGQIDKAVGESIMNSQYLVTIEGEGGKIDINDLGSTSKSLAEATKLQIIQVFKSAVDGNEKLEELYGDFDFEELVNHMIDWVDEDKESLVGGSESSYYEEELDSEFVPPNQPFKTINELHMVKGMTDRLFEILAARVTVYGVKGVNVNYAAKEVLKSLDPDQMTDEVLSDLLERRNDPKKGGPFRDEADLISYLGLDGESFNPSGIPTLYDAEYNFRINASGLAGNSTKEIVAITYDFENLKERMITLLDEEDKEDDQEDGDSGGSGQGGSGSGDTGDTDDTGEKKTTEESKIKVPVGRPSVVYWQET